MGPVHETELNQATYLKFSKIVLDATIWQSFVAIDQRPQIATATATFLLETFQRELIFGRISCSVRLKGD